MPAQPPYNASRLAAAVWPLELEVRSFLTTGQGGHLGVGVPAVVRPRAPHPELLLAWSCQRHDARGRRVVHRTTVEGSGSPNWREKVELSAWAPPSARCDVLLLQDDPGVYEAFLLGGDDLFSDPSLCRSFLTPLDESAWRPGCGRGSVCCANVVV